METGQDRLLSPEGEKEAPIGEIAAGSPFCRHRCSGFASALQAAAPFEGDCGVVQVAGQEP